MTDLAKFLVAAIVVIVALWLLVQLVDTATR